MTMPEKRTIEKARKDRRAGKAPTTQAGEFVREEIDKIRHGEHGARSPQQAIAIGLSKARRAGVRLRPPRKGKAKASTRKSAAYAYSAGQQPAQDPTAAAHLARGVPSSQARTAEHSVPPGSIGPGAPCSLSPNRPAHSAAARKA